MGFSMREGNGLTWQGMEMGIFPAGGNELM